MVLSNCRDLFLFLKRWFLNSQMCKIKTIYFFAKIVLVHGQKIILCSLNSWCLFTNIFISFLYIYKTSQVNTTAVWFCSICKTKRSFSLGNMGKTTKTCCFLFPFFMSGMWRKCSFHFFLKKKAVLVSNYCFVHLNAAKDNRFILIGK